MSTDRNNITIKRIYFPALDGLRFFAFLFVFLHHSLYGLSSKNKVINFFFIAFSKNGWIGVDLFLILSGFLITILLLNESKIAGTFSIKNFYIRRSLRIWPLYYLIIFMGFFVIPVFNIHFFGTDYSTPRFLTETKLQLPYYLLFAGNWAVVFFSYLGYSNISHMWTVSIEEQFYFVWPLLLTFIKSLKRGLIFSILIIIIALLVRVYLSLQHVNYQVVYTNTFARMDTLTYGSLLAFLFFYKKDFFMRFRFILKTPFLIISILILFFLMYRLSLFHTEMLIKSTLGYNLFDLILIYFLISGINNVSLLGNFLSFKLFVWLGKISYGLYAWHLIALELSTHLFGYLNNILLSTLTGFLLTLLLSVISYYLYEIQFLKLKTRFTKINSRPI